MLLWTLLYTVHYLTLEEEIEELKSWNPKNSQTPNWFHSPVTQCVLSGRQVCLLQPTGTWWWCLSFHVQGPLVPHSHNASENWEPLHSQWNSHFLAGKEKKPSRDEYISPSSMLSSSEFARVCFRLVKTWDLKWKQHLLEASDTRGRGEELRVPCTLILQEKTSFCCGWCFILFVVWARLALNSWLTLTGLEVMKDPDCL